MEAASFARLPPPFDYPLVREGKPSHRPKGIQSPYHTERDREVSWSDRSGRPHTGQLRQCVEMEPTGRPTQGGTTGLTTASTPHATHSIRTAWVEELEQTSRPQRKASGRRRPSPERHAHRARTRSPPLMCAHGQELCCRDQSSPSMPRNIRERGILQLLRSNAILKPLSRCRE